MTMLNYAPFIRIALRYGAMFLVSKGIFDAHLGAQLAGDTELVHALEIAIGGIIAAATEIWHAIELKKVKDEKAKSSTDQG